MYLAIDGIYEDGKISLAEAPPTSKRSNVIILFMEEIEETLPLLKESDPEKPAYTGNDLPTDLNE